MGVGLSNSPTRAGNDCPGLLAARHQHPLRDDGSRVPRSRILDEAAPQGIGLAAFTVWEILDGIGPLAPGKHRDDIADRFQGLLDDLFEDRLFDWTYDSVIITRNESEFRNTDAKAVSPWARESR